MSERIRAIAEQCYESKDGCPEYVKFNEQKFAALIISRCCRICDSFAEEGSTESHADEIRRYFGVGK